MSSNVQSFIAEIEGFCRQVGIAETTFGRQVVNDGKFIRRLREGRGVTLRTILKVRDYIRSHPPAAGAGPGAIDAAASPELTAPAPAPSTPPAAVRAPGGQPFRFYDNRQKYLAFVNTCNEKRAIALRAGRELQHIKPRPPALRLFDAGMGDGTVMTLVMRDMHHHFPTVPFVVCAKEISLEDVRLGLEKLPDRFFEHPATVVVVTNLNYAEAPWLMPRDVRSAAALNWHVARLEGDCAHHYGEQIAALDQTLVNGWQTGLSERSGNPVYVRPSVLVIYREDHEFLLDPVIPRPGHTAGNYDLVLASQPWRARNSAEFKARRVLGPLTRALAPAGRLLGIQSCGQDPGLEIVQGIWPDENPFTVNRHMLLDALKKELGRDAREYNFNSFSDAKAVFQYRMHTLPTEIGASIGTSTTFAAWNAAIYVNQIEDERLGVALAGSRFIAATEQVLRKHSGLWFNDETFVVSRRR
ncbi:MAG: hypothetical protein IT495_13525 [Gammaproteobacteria bacterium]|nr:hypothetical protein [Gammaproteobacteria bacterium]